MLRLFLVLLLVLPHALFADGQRFELTRGKSTLEVELSVQFERRAQEELRTWLEALADSLLLAYGHWPRERWRIQVLPASRTGSDPIPWAQVNRGSVDSVTFYTAIDPDADELRTAWTGYHELAHLLIPYQGWGDKWFSEGVATYYQNLLQARAGVFDEQGMWQKLHEGFQRGAEESRFDDEPLTKVSAGMYARGGFMRVYWSGAWYFLAADTRLRQQSGGELSLDKALARLNACCADEQLSVEDMVKRLDRLNRVVLFEPLYRQVRSGRGMPDHLPLFGSLGIRVQDDQVVLQELGPGARLRSSIARGEAL